MMPHANPIDSTPLVGWPSSTTDVASTPPKEIIANEQTEGLLDLMKAHERGCTNVL